MKGERTALHRALDHAAAGADGAALGALLEAWRATRDDGLAGLVAAVGARVTTGRERIPADTFRALHAAWCDVEARGDPGDVDRLLAALSAGAFGAVIERLGRLAARPPDPRIPAALLPWLVAPRDIAWVRPGSRALWDAVFAALEAHGDPRTAVALRTLAWVYDPARPSPFDPARPRGASVRRRLEQRAQAVVAAIERVHGGSARAPLAPEDAAHRDALARRYPPAENLTGEGLLGHVLAHPDDLGARAIYADWLLERGDPRGEFITLQLRRAPDAPASTREARLYTTHWRAWLGDVARIVKSPRFVRGFLAHCSLTDAAVTSPAHPLLATVEALHGRFDDPAAGRFLGDPGLRALRSVRGLSWSAFAALADLDHPVGGVVAVELEDPREHASRNVLEAPGTAALAPRSLPALQAITLRVWNKAARPDEVAGLFSSDLVQRLARVEVTWVGGTFAGWTAVFARAPALQRLDLGGMVQDLSAALVRRADRVVLEVSAWHSSIESVRAGVVWYLENEARGPEPGAWAQAVVSIDGEWQRHAGAIERIQTAVARCGRPDVPVELALRPEREARRRRVRR